MRHQSDNISKAHMSAMTQFRSGCCASAQILPKYVAEFNQKEKVRVTNGNRERNQKKTSQIIQRLNAYGLAMQIRTTGASMHIENFRRKKLLFPLWPRYVGISKNSMKKIKTPNHKNGAPKKIVHKA